MLLKTVWLSFLFTLLGVVAFGQPKIWKKLEKEWDKNAKYIFFLHDEIAEGDDDRPLHPKYGYYEYNKILDTLASFGYVVISNHRSEGSQIGLVAKKTAEQISTLTRGGVPEYNIAVIGMSRGGVMALNISERLLQKEIRYVVISACSDVAGSSNLHGRILSIYDASEGSAHSCNIRLQSATGITAKAETVLQSKVKKGFYYIPNPEWINPTLQWLQAKPKP